ncbi:DUF4936 family protein [Pseudoduganella sp. OTU4001]|uniref:DUF4936 family protein n=1 Tax=Pseudoduganella sp. OTU4001 TaxID=3043854 RepID=UPI00313F02BD
MDLYVYYKVQDADTAGLQAAVIAMQAGLAAAHGVAGQLKRRPAAADGVWTWMEVYPGVARSAADRPDAAFASVLDAAVAEAGLARWISGPRHTEIFEDFPPCA